MADPQRPGEDEPGTPTPEEAGAAVPPVEHDDTGLDVARSISRQLRAAGRGAGAARRRRRRRDAPGGVQSSGAGKDARDPQLIGEALEALLERQGWSTTVNLHLLLGRWPALVGPVNAEHSRPEGYADGVLTVRADSTAWATSLRTMAPQLVARLNEQLGQGTVVRITVLGPDVPSWKHGRRSIRGARGPRDTYG
ncbi:DUF721 domain-containing protein [Auraticoccus sp. F435]|uniref:DUF721 domain-containing protein n=1 Tax=Auraticoccus cholistanensis TaxID=2656650 RepID=A0A6A9UUP4_9ACTN|nr:DUF721 domain-containing protein [Auraticoccus cholistanensis]